MGRKTSPLLRKGSLQHEIYQYLCQQIGSGAFQEAGYLPPVRELAARFGTSISPVYGALDVLGTEGFIERVHGSGVRVVATDRQIALLRARPTVACYSTLRDPGGVGKPAADEHLLRTVQQWMQWRLGQNNAIRLIVCPSTESSPEAGLIDRLLEAPAIRVKVLAFTEPESLSQRAIRAIRKAGAEGVRIVYFATRSDLPECDRVHSDFEGGQYQLTRHLLRNGRRHILRLSLAPTEYFEQQKSAGFERALREAGLKKGTGPSWTALTPEITAERPLVDAYKNLLAAELARRPVDAVMAVNDPAVADVRIALAELAAQKNIEVTGYDANWKEMPWNDKYSPAWLKKHRALLARDRAPASVNTCLPQVGEQLADLVLARALEHLPNRPQIRLVRQELAA